MFVDEVKVKLMAGSGGRGCLSFRREKYEPMGGPNGGNGGAGGDVILVGDENTADLTDYQFVPHAKADNGEPGRGSDQYGARGRHARLRLPLGTVVFDSLRERIVTELTTHGQEVVLLKGGRGGLGNTVFKSSVNQAPRTVTAGEPGEEGEFIFVLKTIADCGLVGYPNAGKSSLLNCLSNARPRVADYPFTTLRPTVGVVDLPELYKRFTMADIPGLIEGASNNRGLGHQFLRHIERCRILAFVLDTPGSEGRDPLEDYAHLLYELKAYNAELLQRPRIVIANKMDEAASEENLHRIRERIQNVPIFPVSCLSDEGLAELRLSLLSMIEALPPPADKSTPAPASVA